MLVLYLRPSFKALSNLATLLVQLLKLWSEGSACTILGFTYGQQGKQCGH